MKLAIARSALLLTTLGATVACEAEQRELLEISAIQATDRAGSSIGNLRHTYGNSILPEDAPSKSGDVDVLHASNSNAAIVRDRRSGVDIEVELSAEKSAAWEKSGGYLVADGVAGPESRLIHRVHAQGLEDFVELAAAPSEGSLTYDVRLGEEVAGLRVLNDTIEFLDAEGTPRLRMNAPYAVETPAKGAAHDEEKTARRSLSVSVEGCAFDTNTAPPWGREVVEPGSTVCRVQLSLPDDLRYPALVDPSWETTADSAIARFGHTLTRLANGKVLAVGGAGEYESIPVPPGYEERGITDPGIAEVEIFDPVTKTWALTGSVARRHSHVAALLTTGEVLVVGGYDGREHLNDSYSEPRYVSTAQRYNPTTGTWSNAASPISAFRAQPAAAVLDDGHVLVVGGALGKNSAQTAETYNPTTNVWTATGVPQRARAHLLAAKLTDGKVLIVGGETSPSSTSEIYDPVARTFGTLRTLPAYLDGTASYAGTEGMGRLSPFALARLASGEVLAAGHRGLIYDPVAASWREVGAPLLARNGGHEIQRVGNDVVLFGGAGLREDDFHLSTELFRPNFYGGLWTTNAAGSVPRWGLETVVLADGGVLVHGGKFPNGKLTEIYRHEVIPEAHVSDYWGPNPWQYGGPLSELKTRIYRPQTLNEGQRYPVIAILHLRSSPCVNASGEFALWDPENGPTGGCPVGFVSRELHRGYGYLAEELARQGFIVVSINWDSLHAAGEDDGDPFSPVTDALGPHFELLRSWDNGTTPTPPQVGQSLANHLDLSRIGLIGHSRGGTAVAKASHILGVPVRAVLSLGMAEGHEFKYFPSVVGKNWVSVVGSCDSGGGESAAGPFDRRAAVDGTSATFAATHVVPGANHNFYNTRVLEDEAPGSTPRCGSTPLLFSVTGTGSTQQLQTALRPALALFSAKVATTPVPLWSRTFDPKRFFGTFPQIWGEFVEKSLTLENFTKLTGTGQYNRATVVTGANTAVVHQGLFSPSSGRQGLVSWDGPGSWRAYFTASGTGLDLSQYTSLDFSARKTSSILNVTDPKIAISLIKADGSLLSVSSPTITALEGSPYQFKRTYRLNFTSLPSSRTAIRGIEIRLGTGTSTTKGEIVITNIRVTKPHE